MALFGMKVKSRRKSAKGLLSTHDVKISNRDIKRHSAQSSARSLGRFAGSWAALTLGLFTCYTATHYAPAIISLDKIIMEGGGPKEQSLALADGGDNVLSPYLELFEIDRTYLRAGQSIRAEYRIPPKGEIELTVVKCQSKLVLEVFRCNPVASRDIIVTDTAGSKEFRFAESGFYHVFDDPRSSPDLEYRVIWSRS